LPWLARVFVQVLLSLLLLAAEGVFFIFAVVSFSPAPFQSPLLYVIQLSNVAVLPNITDTLSEPVL